MAKCPFIDPEFVMPVEEPCPVCGMTGYAWRDYEDKCVGDEDAPALLLHDRGTR